MPDMPDMSDMPDMPESEVVKAVYDTNTVVSGVISGGLPRVSLQLALSGKVNLYVSPPLLLEYRRMTTKPELQNYPNIQRVFEAILRRANRVYPSFSLNVTLHDPDNRVVECAVQARAHYIVTGNKRHYPFSTYEGIKVVNAREFVSEVEPDILLLYP